MQHSLFSLPSGINILPFDGEALFYPDFLTPQESDNYFNHILNSFTWTQEQIKIYDKEVMQPRLTAFCGDAYKDLTYAEKVIHPQPWTKEMIELKQKRQQTLYHQRQRNFALKQLLIEIMIFILMALNTTVKMLRNSGVRYI